MDTMDCDLQNSLAMALIKKGITLGRLGHAEAELHQYEQVVELFGEATRSELQEQVAMALMCRATALSLLERVSEEILVYEQIVERFRDAADPALVKLVASAREFWAETLDQL